MDPIERAARRATEKWLLNEKLKKTLCTPPTPKTHLKAAETLSALLRLEKP